MELGDFYPNYSAFTCYQARLDQSALCVRDIGPIGSRQGTLILRWVGGIKIRIEHRALRRKSRHRQAIITHSA